MSAQATGIVWKYSRHKGSDLLVLLAIADHAKDDGRDAWPSVESLAAKTRLSERNVRYILRALEESGELVIEMNAGPHKANLYHITLGGGAKSAPAKIAPAKFAGGQPSVEGGGNTASQGGAITVAPKPSLEPSNINHQGGGGVARVPVPVREVVPTARPSPTPELVEIPDPFPARWIPDFAREHGLNVNWTEQAALRYVLNYSGTRTRRGIEEWTNKCQKWILEDHEKGSRQQRRA